MAYEQRIIGKYYAIGVDTRDDLELSYSLGSGSYIDKVPGKLLQYGFNDTFLIAVTQDGVGGKQFYYVIDMTKDSDYARQQDFLTGPLTEREFVVQWSSRLNIKFNKVP